MATIVLSAAGMALGGSIGGSVLGLSTAIIGRAAGATLGRVIDQRLLGSGSQAVETGRVDRFRLTGASEGSAVGQVFGQTRIAGQVIWASKFLEDVDTSGGGGKGAPRQPEVSEFSYSISLAIALCEGEITRVGRVWADGAEIARDDLNMRVYKGTDDQLPDPKIEAVEGSGNAPGYRGVAYIVIEDLALGRFGNRIPQLSFEVSRPSQPWHAPQDMAGHVRAVAMMPGTGEYALATTPVTREAGYGETTVANINTPSGKPDLATSLETLTEELPRCGSISLVVSWFGDDLRCGSCSLKPKVELPGGDADKMPWTVSGLDRGSAEVIASVDGRPVYGGTPTDQSVVEAIRAMGEAGQKVVFYPFILMEQLASNALADPWSDDASQPPLPWRGRITLSEAPGRPGSPDGSAAAAAEVSAFFGTARPGDFIRRSDRVDYEGLDEWSYRRFILHNAHLCAVAGGVDSFCIGSEMRSLTQIRGSAGRFVAVEALKVLAREVRQILGADCKIGYAADWSEYFGYQPQDGTGDRYFHLDPLWADPDIDFVGIDNYMPLSDWRDGADHADAFWGSIYDLDYLKANIAGGEGYDWFYASPMDDATQLRTPITDAVHGEPWIWRYKDIRNWWTQRHHERIGGARTAQPTAWIPESKPIWFTEIGCAAIDKGTNQPNKFLDPKSSESSLPRYSNGQRDEFMQLQYLRAIHDFYDDAANNPLSTRFGHRMVDMSRAHVWAWDARPYPFFPNDLDTWSDGANHARGHWITGRASSRPVASVVAEICARWGVTDYDVSRLWGLVKGYTISETDSARAALQPLMLAHGFDAVERDGTLVFETRTGKQDYLIDTARLAYDEGQDGTLETIRAPQAETAGRVRLSFVGAGGDYESAASEAVFPDDDSVNVSQSEFTLVLTRAEGQSITERWLSESRVARDSARFSLPPSALGIGAGDVVRLPKQGLFRIDRVEQGEVQTIEAIRVEPETYVAQRVEEVPVPVRSFVTPVPVEATFLDLPLLGGDEVAHAPHVAMTGLPWPGSVALYSAAQDSGYRLDQVVERPSVVGVTQSEMAVAPAGLWDYGAALKVRLVRGAMSSRAMSEILAGQNLAAIGDGESDRWEVFQFATAELVGPSTYELSARLRGQAGTDGVAPMVWPAGSRFVLLDGTPQQIGLASGARDMAQHYRFGPAQRPISDESFRYQVRAFSGIGLRPYSPCHLSATASASDVEIAWLRRTRIDGDNWSGFDVPLGEDREAYVLRILTGQDVRRQVILAAPRFAYTSSMRLDDGVGGSFTAAVAQVSDRFGPGPFRTLDVFL